VAFIFSVLLHQTLPSGFRTFRSLLLEILPFMKDFRFQKAIAFFLCLLLFSTQIQAQGYDCEEELFSRKDRKTRLFGYVNALGEFRIPPVFLKAGRFIGKNAIVQQGKKFGVINCEGVLVVPADYDEIASFTDGKGWVKSGGLWGLADARGRLLVPLQYEEVKEINLYSGTMSWVKKQGQWGLISKENGRMIVLPAYEDVSSISDSAAICRKSTSQDLVYYGDGRIIIQGMRKVERKSKNLFLYQSNDGKWGAFNALAFIIVRPEFQSISINGPFLQVRKEDQIGFRNFRGGEIHPPRFKTVQPFTDGYSAVSEKGVWQVMDTRGRLLLPDPGGEFAHVLSNGLVVVQKENKNGIWELATGKWILQPIYTSILPSEDGKWCALRQDNKFLFLDLKTRTPGTVSWDSLSLDDPIGSIRAYEKGKVFLLTPPSYMPGTGYDVLKPFGQNHLGMMAGGKWGLLSRTGQVLLPAEADRMEYHLLPGGPVFEAGTGETSTLLSPTGQILFRMQAERILPAINQTFVVLSQGKWGISDKSGNWLVQPKFDSIIAPIRQQQEIGFPVQAWKKGKSGLLGFKGEMLTEMESGPWKYAHEGLWFFKGKSGWALYNNTGKAQGNLFFDEVDTFSEGNAPVRLAGKWGFLNSTGRLVIPTRFEEVLPYQNGIAYAKESGKWGVLKKNGSWLVKPVGLGVDIDETGKRRLRMP
jgi:hypothetical protein